MHVAVTTIRGAEEVTVGKIKVRSVSSVILFSALTALITLAQSAIGQESGPRYAVPVEKLCPAYSLGPLDQIVVRSLNGERLNETLMVAEDNTITLPLIGKLAVAGMSAEELQQKANQKLKAFIRDPNISVSLATPQSRHVSIIGSVNQPGVRAVRGCTTLIEVISMAGGLQPDAGNVIEITRSARTSAGEDTPQPLGAAAPEVIHVRVSDLIEASRPEANILIQPGDVVSVPRSRLIYVVGAVQKAGGFVLNERDSLSALQALSLAGGLAPTPAPQSARILRGSGTSNRTEIAVDMRKILNGKSPDVLLQADDILFIPSSTLQKVTVRTIEAAIQTATGIAVWH
jgi:polysaccharide biosynthesis/export protein